MKDIIQKKLESYQAQTEQDEENALKEITQEIALYALSKSGFFEVAAFQGGTALRILYGLDRFSEDLDFALLEPRTDFNLVPYLEACSSQMNSFGYQMEIGGKDKTDTNVKKRFLKDESIKKMLAFKHLSQTKKKINIKVELDVNPPIGAQTDIKFPDFPTDCSVVSHDLPSLFAGKLHALLCRTFLKGRDWYDFSWYVSQRVKPNYALLENALVQQGPWMGQKIRVSQDWIAKELAAKIKGLNWASVVADVSPFLKAEKTLEIKKLWGEKFFLAKLETLIGL